MVVTIFDRTDIFSDIDPDKFRNLLFSESDGLLSIRYFRDNTYLRPGNEDNYFEIIKKMHPDIIIYKTVIDSYTSYWDKITYNLNDIPASLYIEIVETQDQCYCNINGETVKFNTAQQRDKIIKLAILNYLRTSQQKKTANL